jgi:hypothetical protein
MPTDVFNSSQFFLGRGVGVARTWKETRIFGFAGATSIGFGTPYFRAADADKGVGLLFWDRQLTPTLSAFSRTVFSSRQSAINGLEWQPRPGLRMAVGAGLGAGQGYSATSLSLDREWVALKTAYIRAGNRFRRIAVEQPLSSEVDRENVMLTLRPSSSLMLSAGRQNFLQPLSQGGSGIRGTVNQYSVAFAAERFNASAALFDSQVVGLRSRGASFTVGRDILSRVQASGNFLWNRAGNARPLTSVLGTFREKISPRLSLLQLVNHSQGRTTASFGGNLVSNRISIGVEYQTLYLPFRTGNQFKQALVLNIQLRPFGNVQLNAGTYVAPDGSVRYTAYGRTFLYNGNLNGTPSGQAVNLHRYVVRGRVIDAEGNPVRGAALRIDGEMAFTDSAGDFFVRKKKRQAFQLEVLVDQFIVPGRFEVVSAPASVRAEPDDSAGLITIVVRRIVGGHR